MSIYGPDGECRGSSDYAKKTCVDTQNNLQVAKASNTMTGALDMSKNKVTGLAGPTAAQDVATKEYVDTVVRGRGSGDLSDYAEKTYVDTQNNLKVAKAGETMTSALAMSNNNVMGLAGPTAAQDVATKEYVDTLVRGRLKAIVIAGQSNTSQASDWFKT